MKPWEMDGSDESLRPSEWESILADHRAQQQAMREASDA